MIINPYAFSGGLAPAQEFLAKVVAYYPMDTDTASVVGTSNAFTGTAPTYVAGVAGNGIHLNGVLVTPSIPASMNGTKMSIGGWFRIRNASNLAFIFGTRSSSTGAYDRFQVSNDGTNKFRIYSTLGVVAGSAIVVNTWQHVVATFASGKITIYVDGVPYATSVSGSISGATSLMLGAAYQNSFAMDADECFCSNDALSADCVSYLYNAGAGRSWADINS